MVTKWNEVKDSNLIKTSSGIHVPTMWALDQAAEVYLKTETYVTN